MPTLRGLRRRGVPPEAIREFEPAHRRRQGNSTSVEIAQLEHPMREDLNTHGPRAVMAVCEPAQAWSSELPGGPESRNSTRSTTRGPRGRHPQGAVLPGALHRARRLHGRSAQEVLPPRARARGAPALRLLPDLPRRSIKDANGERRRAALHLRSRNPRRQRTRRPQGQGDDALGLGHPCRRGGSAALRHAFHQCRPGERRRLSGRPQSRPHSK